ncbi:hypothetical protein GCM10007874_69550 [Labrys miyagiensis]|uniref:DUF4175 domain-containing protein n=1 Tax=Labrys miyagiensis TaxID=346912 RepID=A0ABQ6CUZ6_9HYPH|nr:hypothetical protein GCM10007874_69550 [Labrys miyagiensis]
MAEGRRIGSSMRRIVIIVAVLWLAAYIVPGFPLWAPIAVSIVWVGAAAAVLSIFGVALRVASRD